MNAGECWDRYKAFCCRIPSIDLTLDISRMAVRKEDIEAMTPAMHRALGAMDDLERGGIANPDENRMVGHYWLRAPRLAPDPAITAAIEETVAKIKAFAAGVHSGRWAPPGADRFTEVLSVGIGGSALGPMFLHDALGDVHADKMSLHFVDNTDPQGITDTLAQLGDRLVRTMCLVISKSGTTPETRNGMIAVSQAYRAAGLDFAKHAVAVTGAGSSLDQQAERECWLERFPMWDWVGGRTSLFSAVGLLPAALQGLDIDALLDGAAACDAVTRGHDVLSNPSALLALAWYQATGGKGEKHMVVLPYKDRLLLLSRYLQQLVMESLGKRVNLNGERVDQGLTVYGNKGSTDQHAYVQQLRDGVNNFFAAFIRVLEAGAADVVVDEPAITAGDYLHAFLLGTREALSDNDRQTLTLTVPRVDARNIGVLIALFERAVGLYGFLIGVNAYHQPGVEAGKRAAASVLALQAQVIAALSEAPQTAGAIAGSIGARESAETVYALLEHLSHNGRAALAGGDGPATATFVRAAD